VNLQKQIDAIRRGLADDAWKERAIAKLTAGTFHDNRVGTKTIVRQVPEPADGERISIAKFHDVSRAWPGTLEVTATAGSKTDTFRGLKVRCSGGWYYLTLDGGKTVTLGSGASGVYRRA